MTDVVWIASSCALILIVILIRAVFGKKMSAGFRYALWAIVLLRLLIPGVVFHSPVSVKTAVSGSEVVRDLQAVEGISSVTRNDSGVVVGEKRTIIPQRKAPSPVGEEKAPPVVVIEQEATAERFEQIKKTVEARDILNIVWYSGMGLTAAYFVFVNIRFYKRLKKSRVPIPANSPCRVYAVPGLGSSCLFMNAVYVAKETAEDKETLRCVLAHELAHRRHGDAIFAFLRSAALILHWYDPLVWLAAILSRRDSELFADEGAINALGEDSRESYLTTLITLSAGNETRANIACAATSMTNGKHELKERITHAARRRRTGILIAAVVTLIALLAVGCSFLGGKSGNDAKPTDAPELTSPAAEKTPDPTHSTPDAHMTPDPTEDPNPTPEAAVFSSSALEACVREQLKLSDGEPITASAIKNLEYLAIEGEGIEDLNELVIFTGLKALSVYKAPNADFTALKELSQIEDLSIMDCSIYDISFIRDLPWIKRLVLSGNYITDISPITALTGLKVLDLTNNRVSDLSPLLSMNGLGDVSLSWNPITNDQANELRRHVKMTGDEYYGASVSFYTAEEDTARWAMDLDGDGREEYFCAQLALLIDDFVSFAWVEDADGRQIGRLFYLGTGHVAFNTFAVVDSPEFGVCLMRIAPEFGGEYYGFELLRAENGDLVSVYSKVLYNYDDEEATAEPDPVSVELYNEQVNALLETGCVLITTDRWGVMKKELYLMKSGKRLDLDSDECPAVICTAGCSGNGIKRLRSSLKRAGVMLIDERLGYRMDAKPSGG